MRLRTTIFLIAYLLIVTLKAQDVDIQTLRQRIYAEYYATTTGNTSNLTSLQSNGLWPDINYADRSITNWDPIKHLQRVRSMAKSYCDIADKQSVQAVNLLAGIENALNAWYAGGYKSDNWFFNDIGQQREIGPTLALIYNYLQPTTLTKACNYLITKSGFSGTNLVWMASMVMIRGAVQNDITLINQAVSQIGSTVNPVNKGREGIQKDNAYLYHGLQIYNGGYGNWFIVDVSFWFYLTRGLSFQFSATDIGYLRGLILEGDQWMIRRGQYDFGATGRNITRRWQIASTGMKTPAERMKGIDPSNASKYQLLIDHINGTKNDNVTGNKHFFRSDMMVQRRSDYYFSVKMCSARTNGTEFMNGENAKGYWLPFGATCLMRDATEYNSIFPLWDWTKVPGVTAAEETPSFGATLNQATSFVGGVTDGNCGVATMDLTTRNLYGKKSWFMFNGEIVALGAGITSGNTNAITTSLAQSIMRNSVFVNGKTASEAIGGVHQKVKHIWHDNVAYVFPDSTNIKLTNSYKAGAWYDINTSQPKDVITAQVFNPWIDHGKNPSNAGYAYVVVPRIANADLPGYALNLPVKILSNSSQIQAVTHVNQQLTGIVFHSAGQITIDNGLAVSADQPCAILVDQQSEPVRITLSDPAQTKSSINITLRYSAYPQEILNFSMPVGDLGGSSISKNAQTIRSANFQGVTLTRIPVVPLSTGETFTVEKQLICNNCSSVPHTWHSSNEGVATVDANGKITAIANGEATISIILTESNKTESFRIDVMEKVLVENFENLNALTFLPGGNWSNESGELRLTNPVGAAVPSPENNIALFNYTITGDFVMTGNMWVDETTSTWNDLCLIWGHQHPALSYFYAHLCENNDDAGSGIFKITNGSKSTQLADIPLSFTAGAWHRVMLKVKQQEAKIYVDNQLTTTLSEQQFSTGKIGFGSYNDACRFDSVVIWQQTGQTNTGNITTENIKIYFQQENIIIHSGDEKILSINLYDISGQKIESTKGDNSINIKNISAIRTGIIFIDLVTDKNRYHYKLLKH